MPNAKVEFQLDEFDISELEVCRPNWPPRVRRDKLMNGSNNLPPHMYPRFKREIMLISV